MSKVLTRSGESLLSTLPLIVAAYCHAASGSTWACKHFWRLHACMSVSKMKNCDNVTCSLVKYCRQDWLTIKTTELLTKREIFSIVLSIYVVISTSPSRKCESHWRYDNEWLVLKAAWIISVILTLAGNLLISVRRDHVRDFWWLPVQALRDSGNATLQRGIIQRLLCCNAHLKIKHTLRIKPENSDYIWQLLVDFYYSALSSSWLFGSWNFLMPS